MAVPRSKTKNIAVFDGTESESSISGGDYSVVTPYGTVERQIKGVSNNYRSRSVNEKKRPSKIQRDIDESISHNMSQINNYKKELNDVLNNLD